MNIKAFWAAVALLAIATGFAAASPPSPAKPLRVLFIGSSLSYQNGLPQVFASPAGTYVAACVIYSAIFGKPVPTDGADGVTKASREAAWEVVRPAR